MPESTEQRVRTWCEEENLFLETVEEAESLFRFRVAAPSVPAVIQERVPYDSLLVVQPRETPDRVVVSAGIDFGNAFAALTPDQILQIQDLEIALESRPEGYWVNMANQRLHSLFVFEEIFLDGLTKDRFMRAVRGVNKSFAMALWYLNPLLEEVAPRPAPEGVG